MGAYGERFLGALEEPREGEAYVGEPWTSAIQDEMVKALEGWDSRPERGTRSEGGSSVHRRGSRKDTKVALPSHVEVDPPRYSTVTREMMAQYADRNSN